MLGAGGDNGLRCARGAEPMTVRRRDELTVRLVIPARESTTMSHLLSVRPVGPLRARFRRMGFRPVVRARASEILTPVAAGAARRQCFFFGSQVDSLKAISSCCWSRDPVRAVFIQAPWVESGVARCVGAGPRGGTSSRCARCGVFHRFIRDRRIYQL